MRIRVGRPPESRNKVADSKPARYKASQMGAKINAVQKEIGQLRKVGGISTFLPHTGADTEIRQAKQDADHLLKQKVELEKEKKQVEEEAIEKEKLRDKKCKTIGNYVHESVPVNDNEVRGP
jgi:seryl-tRNA synthetase